MVLLTLDWTPLNTCPLSGLSQSWDAVRNPETRTQADWPLGTVVRAQVSPGFRVSILVQPLTLSTGLLNALQGATLRHTDNTQETNTRTWLWLRR